LRSELLLRRAHLVLAAIVHIYVHSQPLLSLPIIPQSIGIPLLRISRTLQIPPVLTYSDTVLYNWELRDPYKPISEENIRMSTLLSSTSDEAHFYLTSALIELRGVKALELMRSTMNEAFIGDSTAARRITAYLIKLSNVIEELTQLLVNVKSHCSPTTFYKEVRPWLRGGDGHQEESSSWVFENAELFGLSQPNELSGPSGGQSSLIHSLDTFFGIHKHTHAMTVKGQVNPFLERMKLYTPRHHRAFLNHLEKEPQLRDFVALANSSALEAAYNEAVRQLKLFRDQHIRIVALYIITPSRSADCSSKWDGRGTGGTDVLPLLKSVRDQTLNSLLR
jgi:indoleamine 2,3-dioxygenase